MWRALSALSPVERTITMTKSIPEPRPTVDKTSVAWATLRREVVEAFGKNRVYTCGATLARAACTTYRYTAMHELTSAIAAALTSDGVPTNPVLPPAGAVGTYTGGIALRQRRA